MFKKISTSCLLVLLLILMSADIYAQHSLKFLILDSSRLHPLQAASVSLEGRPIGGFSNDSGIVLIEEIPTGEYTCIVKHLGYQDVILDIGIPFNGPQPIKILMIVDEEQMDAVVIEATRANRSIANLPTRTEALTEEIDEAASMEPSKISHLLTHSTGIQVQTTAATSNGAVVRIQGLNGRYTQMLRDGFPMYGGLSGSLDILQIPPLDLRQVEYIKGPASTLYGGGAIGGIVNLLSKKPNEDESLLHLNYSNIGARDLNTFISRRINKFGYTNLASFHIHNAYDPNKDGFSDVPEVLKINFNPKLFYNPRAGTEFYFGLNILVEKRLGGDMSLINKLKADSSHFYLDNQNSRRIISQFNASHKLTNKLNMTFKNSVSRYARSILISMNEAGEFSAFNGYQFNTFSELNLQYEKPKHMLTCGLNIYTDKFTENEADSAFTRNQHYFTTGLFVNHLWDLNRFFSVESGIRLDQSKAQSAYSSSDPRFFALPRISALYKLKNEFSFRISAAMGYRMPTIFNEEAEPFAYVGVQPIDFSSVKAEESYGGNFDIRYVSTLGFDDVLLSLNQLFYLNSINQPLVLYRNGSELSFVNYDGELTSRGFETQLKLTVHKFTWFLGYTFTQAYLDSSGSCTHLILTPVHSIKGDLLFVIDGRWRIGWDYEYKSGQFLSGGSITRSLFTTGVVIERTIESFVFFLNGENLTDIRQTKYESTLSQPHNTTQFTEIWAPLDGLFLNLGLKIKL